MNDYVAPVIESKIFPEFFDGLPSMKGKTVVITGTTTGLGFVIASSCRKLGADLLLLNRTSARSEAAEKKLNEIESEGSLSCIACDLQSKSSVLSAIEEVKAAASVTTNGGIYAIGCNAGIMALPDKATEDGYDIQMQTNHLSHFLLIQELYSLLESYAEKEGEARIVIMASGLAWGKPIPLEQKYFDKNGGNLGGDDVPGAFQGAPYLRYRQSKLANVNCAKALANKASESKNKVNAYVAVPGWSITPLQTTSQAHGGMTGVTTQMAENLAQSAEDGTHGFLTCLCLPDIESGSIYGPENGCSGVSVPLSLDDKQDLWNDESQKLLWEASCAFTGKEW